MVFTADTAGSAGNLITVEYNTTNRAAGHSSAECHTSGTTICVDLKTSAGVAASGVLTSDNTNVADGATVTIGTIVYRFKDTMAQAYDVQIGADADTSMGNLIKAINGSGTVGAHYYTGTVAHTLVTAGTLSAHAFTVTAISIGAAGNLIAKAEDSAHLDWDGTGAYLTGGEDVNQILSTAAEVKTAIEANTEAAALVNIANAGGNDGSGVVTVLAVTALSGGSDGTVELFEIKQDGLIAVYGNCTKDLASSGAATISAGITGSTAALIPLTTATDIDNGERIDITGVIASTAAPMVTPFYPVKTGDIIKLTVGTASITEGTLEMRLFYKSFSSSGATVGTNNDAAITTDVAGTISGKLRGLVKMVSNVWDSVTTAFRTRETYAPVYEDNVNGKAVVEHRYSYDWATADKQIKASSGFVHALHIAPLAASPTAGLLTVYDNSAGSGSVLYSEWIFATTPGHSILLDKTAGTGIYVEFDGTLANVGVGISFR